VQQGVSDHFKMLLVVITSILHAQSLMSGAELPSGAVDLGVLYVETRFTLSCSFGTAIFNCLP